MPAKKQYENHASPDTGKLLKEYFSKKRIRKNALARALGKNKSTLYRFLDNNTMQTSVLWEICVVLKHNFLLDIASQLPKEFSNNVTADNTAEEKITQLEQEIAILKAERDLLQKVLIGKTG